MERQSTSNKTVFSGLQANYNKARPFYPEAALQQMAGLLPVKTGKILDVGCGTGILTRQLCHVLPEANITGCDINSDMIAQAKAADAKTGARYLVSNAEALPANDNTLSMITVAQAVQWFDRPAFFKESRRALAEDTGILVLIENNRDWQNSEFLYSYETLLETHSPDYSRHYRDHHYEEELKQAGFVDVALTEYSWVREMRHELFRKMALSSSKIQAAIKASDGVILDALESLASSHLTKGGFLQIAYNTVMISARHSG